MKNPRVKINTITNLSDAWNRLDRVNFNYQIKNGTWQNQDRESYFTGDGACILLYNIAKNTVILIKQFRMPSYIDRDNDGMMIEVCAGLLDNDDPVTCIIKEVEEETGYKIDTVKKVLEVYSSPGAMTEKLYYFITEYNETMKVSDGGGLVSETEEIEVLEYNFDTALKMINSGEIKDAKTILLLQYIRINRIM